MSEYTKVVTSIDEQIELLKRRKLYFDDLDKARKYLTHIGYYRLSQYFKANQFFKKKGKKIVYKDLFRDDTHFKNIIDLYIFDRELRLLIMDMIERIEISIRSVVINELSLNKKDPLCYLDKSNYKSEESANFIINIIEENISSKRFNSHDIGNHFQGKYTKSKYPAIWMLLNTSDFGLVTNIYKNLKAELREKISQVYDLDEKIFGQQIEVIRRIRNIVSHHERLFNTSFSYGGSKGSSIKFHDFIKEIDYLKNQIVPTSHWNDKIVKLYNDYEYLTPVKKYKYEI